MAGLLEPPALERVFNAWRRAMRQDPLLSRVPMPELRPLAAAFNIALTGDDSDELVAACTELVRGELDAPKVVRITTFLAETFTDEVGTTSGAITKSLVGTLGHVCGLMITTMVGDASEQAYRDALTGLENRRAWDQTLAQYVRTGRVAIAMIDLDGLKKINDQQGHEAGDKHLKKFAADLSGAIAEPTRAYRFGGDEYALMRLGDGHGELQRTLAELCERDDVAAFSYGIADSVSDGQDAFVNAADERMYAMKRARKEAHQAAVGAV
jgi:diguanylate cyclase (GGDEF)-like protein